MSKKNKKNLLIAVALLYASVAQSQIQKREVLIITIAFNRPDFIELQYRCLKKNFKDPYHQSSAAYTFRIMEFNFA